MAMTIPNWVLPGKTRPTRVLPDGKLQAMTKAQAEERINACVGISKPHELPMLTSRLVLMARMESENAGGPGTFAREWCKRLGIDPNMGKLRTEGA